MKRMMILYVILGTIFIGAVGVSAYRGWRSGPDRCADAMVITYRESVASGIDPLSVSGRSLPECQDLSTADYTRARELTRNRLSLDAP